MSKKKNKFDLTHLVKEGRIRDGETLFFVSDPKQNCKVKMMPNHEFKVDCQGETFTIHAICHKFLGSEPPEHASRWLRNDKGKTLYELWQTSMSDEEAA